MAEENGGVQPEVLGKRRASVTESRVSVRVSQKAYEDIAKVETMTGGRVPSKWLARTTQILAADDYRKHKTLFEEVKADEMIDGKTKHKAHKLGLAAEKGWISGRTAADALVTPGTNPFSADQIGMSIILTFRRKAMAFIIFQSLFINMVALALDRFGSQYFPDFPWYYFLGVWLVPTLTLLALSCVRYQVPVNYVLLFLFTLMMGVAMGVLGPPMQYYAGDDVVLYSPQCYGLFGHTVALILLTAITSIVPMGDKVIKMAPTGVGVAIFTDIVGVAAYFAMFSYIGPVFFLAIMIFMHTLSILWISYQMDKLGARLLVDEWIQPVILLWCEIFVVLAVVLVLVMLVAGMEGGGADAGAGGGEGYGGMDACTHGCYGVYCDCYIYYGQEEEEKAEEEEEEAPEQQGV